MHDCACMSGHRVMELAVTLRRCTMTSASDALCTLHELPSNWKESSCDCDHGETSCAADGGFMSRENVRPLRNKSRSHLQLSSGCRTGRFRSEGWLSKSRCCRRVRKRQAVVLWKSKIVPEIQNKLCKARCSNILLHLTTRTLQKFSNIDENRGQYCAPSAYIRLDCGQHPHDELII